MSTPLHIADRVFADISRKTWLVAFVNPTNLSEEEKSFHASKNYEPKFSYRPFTQAEAFQTRLDSINVTERTALGTLFRNVKESVSTTIKALKNRGTGRFSVLPLYGSPPRSLVQKAHRILETIPKQPPAILNYTASQLKAAFEKELNKYGFVGWNIILKRMVSKVAVSPSKRSVIIRDNAKFSEKDVKSLLVHEIGVHVLRAMNGYRQHYKIFGTDAVPGYLATEEGLAAVHEQKAGCLTNNRLRRYAGRVIAANAALKGSFRNVFNELVKCGFTPKESFALTVRVKRGLKDTSQAGGFIKDHVYLEGKLKLDDFVYHGGKLTQLYAGKIGLEHIGLVEEGIIEQPVYLPKF